VSFDIRGSEYNGKYYVNLACWKIQSGGASSGGASSSREPSNRSSKATSSNEPTASDFRSDGDFDDENPF
jgi:hypothetical protein